MLKPASGQGWSQHRAPRLRHRLQLNNLQLKNSGNLTKPNQEFQQKLEPIKGLVFSSRKYNFYKSKLVIISSFISFWGQYFHYSTSWCTIQVYSKYWLISGFVTWSSRLAPYRMDNRKSSEKFLAALRYSFIYSAFFIYRRPTLYPLEIAVDFLKSL